MSGDRYYRCLRCGYVGTEVKYDEGLPVAAVCATCGSCEIEPCAAPPEGRSVPLRVLYSAESQALHWKKQHERLSLVVNAAIQAGCFAAPYAGEAKRIMAGVA